jgi:protein TonB
VSTFVPAGSPAQLGGTTGSQPLLLSGELSVSCSERTAPVYPKQSLRLAEQGKTVLLVELDELGRVSNVTLKSKSGFPRLDEAAINAVKTWRCNPAKRNGVAVRSVALQPFNFILKGR